MRWTRTRAIATCFLAVGLAHAGLRHTNANTGDRCQVLRYGGFQIDGHISLFLETMKKTGDEPVKARCGEAIR